MPQLNTPLRVEKNREDCVRIVDKDGYPLTAFEPNYSHGDDYRDLVQAANRQAAADKLADEVTTVLRMCKDAIDPFVASSDKPHGGNLLAIVSDINEAIEALSAYRATEVPRV